MAQTLTALGAKLVANAANVATQMGGGTTTAEVTALGDLVAILGARNDLAYPALKLLNSTDGPLVQPN